jgi:hypothetical protein
MLLESKPLWNDDERQIDECALKVVTVILTVVAKGENVFTGNSFEIR